MVGEVGNWCVSFILLTVGTTAVVFATGGTIAFLMIKWENRLLEHFLKPIMFGLLIALLGVGWRFHRPGAPPSFRPPARIFMLGAQ